MAQFNVKGMLSGGEIVLIDTRQHWMAAVRYALKPILLLGLVVLLVIFNQAFQPDGFLRVINTLVHWALIIAIIVAAVWLPINLVQWWSRRYVLTNRRAMRMQGVLRKSSFDSSLEQINDIGLEQTFLGRQLGYANLTLFTASDTANETYEQLMDGLQFKKAVMDAKEAIRSGTPLMGLPEGFIVKGGTNEASMRADGKIEEAATRSGPPLVEQDEGGTSEASAGGAGVAAAAVVLATEPEPAGDEFEPSGEEPEPEHEPGPTAEATTADDAWRAEVSAAEASAAAAWPTAGIAEEAPGTSAPAPADAWPGEDVAAAAEPGASDTADEATGVEDTGEESWRPAAEPADPWTASTEAKTDGQAGSDDEPGDSGGWTAEAEQAGTDEAATAEDEMVVAADDSAAIGHELDDGSTSPDDAAAIGHEVDDASTSADAAIIGEAVEESDSTPGDVEAVGAADPDQGPSDDLAAVGDADSGDAEPSMDESEERPETSAG